MKIMAYRNHGNQIPENHEADYENAELNHSILHLVQR